MARKVCPVQGMCRALPQQVGWLEDRYPVIADAISWYLQLASFYCLRCAVLLLIITINVSATREVESRLGKSTSRWIRLDSAWLGGHKSARVNSSRLESDTFSEFLTRPSCMLQVVETGLIRLFSQFAVNHHWSSRWAVTYLGYLR